MTALVECIPNFSEGSDAATLDALATAIQGGGAWLLDRTADVDHERSVFTMAGGPPEVVAASTAAVEVAIERIDMRTQRGQHPRIGAADVIPFVPLGSTSLEACIEEARRFAAVIAERFDLPVYLYAEAARRPDRRILSGIRRAGYEGLAAWMAAPGHGPDLGPAQPHPTAGATTVGARRMLIAFNIQLTTSDVALARRIAARIRERDGGLAALQALGLWLASEGRAQVSMNLLDHERTPLWQVWEEVGRLARAEGVEAFDSELIGLAPVAAFVAVADHIGVPPDRPLEEQVREATSWLRMRRPSPDMALELRLARFRRDVPA